MHITSSGVQIGPVLISAYALIVVLAVVVGVTITWYRARTRGQDSAIAFDLGTWMLPLAVIVGRVFYVLSPPPSANTYYSRDWYLSHPFDLLVGPVAVWNGGLGTAGAIIGASLAAFLVLRNHQVDIWLWADILVPGCLAAAALLPWSNLVSKQLLGPPTNLPWGVTAIRGSENLGALAGYPPVARFHPTPAYVSLWASLVLATLMIFVRRYRQRWLPGHSSLYAGVALLPGLFLADLLRTDVSRGFLGLSGMQTLSIVIEIVLVLLLLRRSSARLNTAPSSMNFTEN